MSVADHETEKPLTPEELTIGRRRFLKGLLGLGVVGGASYVAIKYGRDVWEWQENKDARDLAASMFEDDGLFSWHKFTVVPTLLQIDPSVKVSESMFGTATTNIACPPDEFYVVQQPIVVKNTWLRNVADYNSAAQSSIDRAIPNIPSGLLAFYQPNNGKFVYLDADQNDGLIVPITSVGIPGNLLDIQDIDITGREVRGDVVYPYTSQLEVNIPPNYNSNSLQQPQAVENYQFIGQSFLATTLEEFNALAANFTLFNEYPVKFPPA